MPLAVARARIITSSALNELVMRIFTAWRQTRSLNTIEIELMCIRTELRFKTNLLNDIIEVIHIFYSVQLVNDKISFYGKICVYNRDASIYWLLFNNIDYSIDINSNIFIEDSFFLCFHLLVRSWIRRGYVDPYLVLIQQRCNRRL